MSYVAKWFFRDGRTAHETAPFATREDADNYAKTLNTAKGYTYTIEEVPDVSTAAVPDAPPSIGVMPRRVWQEQRIRALGEAIARRMGHEYPTVASVFDLAQIHDWAAEIVELCQRNGGQQTAPNDAKEVPEAPEPGSTAAHHVEILRGRVKNLEALVATVAKQADELAEVNKAMSQDLAFALQLGDALRQAMRTGAWRAGQDAGMASNAIAGWDRWKPSLGKAPSASEAPGEGGDWKQRRLEVLERFLDGDTFRQVWKTTQGNIVAGTTIEGQEYAAPTLAALADKLAAKEDKP